MASGSRPSTPIAILSDVHANRQALAAVRDEMDRRGVAGWWCVGDLVGYGGAPHAVVDAARASAGRCVAGNHDLVVAGRLPVRAFASWARDAAAWTADALDAERRAWLAALRPVDRDPAVTLVHASLRDPVWEYLTGSEDAAATVMLARSPLTLFGHTHVPAAWREEPHGGVASVAAAGVVDVGTGRWLVNPGSVGQPRDGDPRAAWAIYDPASGTVEFIRTAYDIAGAQADIRAAGLPDLLADRLGEGL